MEEKKVIWITGASSGIGKAVAINRATMTKFGIKVAELTVVFVKD